MPVIRTSDRVNQWILVADAGEPSSFAVGFGAWDGCIRDESFPIILRVEIAQHARFPVKIMPADHIRNCEVSSTISGLTGALRGSFLDLACSRRFS